MKKIFILLLIPVVSFGQKKFDNTIVINEYVSMEKLKSVLFDAGFVLQGTDTSYLETGQIKQKNDEVYIKLRMKRTDSSMVLKGLMKINIEITLWGVSTPPEFEPIVYWKDKKSRPRIAFDLMDNLAKSLSTNITYLKQ